jgi:hypothetical protein
MLLAMSLSNLGIAALALGVLIALVLAPRKLVRAPAFGLLRCLFPSWRFFEAISPPPRLSYRSLMPGQPPGPWLDALVPEPRAPSALLLNARGNLFLACQSLEEQLCADLETASGDVTQLVSYRLVQTLVALRMPDSAPCQFQFRLSENDATEQEIFVSSVHAA